VVVIGSEVKYTWKWAKQSASVYSKEFSHSNARQRHALEDEKKMQFYEATTFCLFTKIKQKHCLQKYAHNLNKANVLLSSMFSSVKKQNKKKGSSVGSER